MSPDQSIFIVVLDFLEGRWKIITAFCVAISWVAGVELRLSALERKPKKRSVEECEKIMSVCSASNTIRFNDGRREFDSLSAAINRLNDSVRIDIKTTNDKLDRLIDHLLDGKNK